MSAPRGGATRRQRARDDPREHPTTGGTYEDTGRHGGALSPPRTSPPARSPVYVHHRHGNSTFQDNDDATGAACASPAPPPPSLPLSRQGAESQTPTPLAYSPPDIPLPSAACTMPGGVHHRWVSHRSPLDDGSGSGSGSSDFSKRDGDGVLDVEGSFKYQSVARLRSSSGGARTAAGLPPQRDANWLKAGAKSMLGSLLSSVTGAAPSPSPSSGVTRRAAGYPHDHASDSSDASDGGVAPLSTRGRSASRPRGALYLSAVRSASQRRRSPLACLRRVPGCNRHSCSVRDWLCRATVVCVLLTFIPVVKVILGLKQAPCPSKAMARYPGIKCDAAPMLARSVPPSSSGHTVYFSNFLTPLRDTSTDHFLVLSTQMTLDRIPRLERLATTWRGPISAAVFLCTSAEVTQLQEWYASSPILQEYVWMHVVVGKDTYLPINTIRNVAAFNAQKIGRWLMVLDVDNLPSHPASVVTQDVVKAAKIVQAAGGELNKTMLVLPSLETTDADTPVDVALDMSKAQLAAVWRAGDIQTMHPYNPESYHGPFDIGVWLFRDQLYEVEYQRKFESYYITHRPIMPFDERFIGRRRNKQSQHFEMWAAGFRFWVLPNTWVVDTPHTTGIHTESPELMYNRKWAQFLSEITAKYDLKCRRPSSDCWWVQENMENYPLLSILREDVKAWQMRRECPQDAPK